MLGKSFVNCLFIVPFSPVKPALNHYRANQKMGLGEAKCTRGTTNYKRFFLFIKRH